MRLLRKFTLIEIILWLIFLGIFIVVFAAALLFGEEFGGIKILGITAFAILCVIIRLFLALKVLQSEQSRYIENMKNRVWIQKKALEQREKIQKRRLGHPGQIDDRSDRVLSGQIAVCLFRLEPLMRVYRSKVMIGLFFYVVITFAFRYVFNYRLSQSVALGLIAAFLTEGVVHVVIRHRIAALFDREFPPASSGRAMALDHLSENQYTLWFAPDLLKIVGQR